MTDGNEVVVGTFPEAMAAHLVRMQLDAEGIDSYLADENIVSIYPLYFSAIGGIKLMVREEDAQAAFRIIEGVESEAFTRYKSKQAVCPVCGSEHVGEKPLAYLRTLVLTILTIGLFLPFFYRSRKCEDCGHTW
ncbi:MAG: DUF2007 domain-containing protein [Candidatus Hydrogenedentes bacterium]|nr:DUF2007 domain-containing protein [Candidatus Hydrogenedentota bacterium]